MDGLNVDGYIYSSGEYVDLPSCRRVNQLVDERINHYLLLSSFELQVVRERVSGRLSFFSLIDSFVYSFIHSIHQQSEYLPSLEKLNIPPPT